MIRLVFFFMLFITGAGVQPASAQTEKELAAGFCPCFKTLQDSASQEIQMAFAKAAQSREPKKELDEAFRQLIREGKVEKLEPVLRILKDTSAANPVRCMDATLERLNPDYVNEKRLIRELDANCPMATVLYRIGLKTRN